MATDKESSLLQKPADIFSREEIKALSARSNLRGAGLILHCWATIGLTWFICIEWTHPAIILVGIAIVGARQLGLAIIGHDAAHHVLFENRQLNDWAAEWLLNRALVGASITPYRNYHFVHHRHTQQAGDPDLPLSTPFPTSRASLRRKIIRDLTGQTGFKQYGATIKGAFYPDDGFSLHAGVRRLAPNFLINLAFLAVFMLAGKWYLYFLLWIVPALTWHSLVSRIRNIAEHAVVPDNDDRLRNTRTTIASWPERMLLAPYFVNYHLEHHLLVSAPCYRLPAVHELLKSKGLMSHMEVRQGYAEVLRIAAPVNFSGPPPKYQEKPNNSLPGQS